MRHFLLPEAFPLPVLLLPDGVREASVECGLVLTPRALQALLPRCRRALPAAVDLTPITGATEAEDGVTATALPNP